MKRNLRCGYLDYEYHGKRDGNIGGEIIYNLASKIINTERCTADCISNYDVVLVSIPSSGQMIDILNIAIKHNWSKRKCKIIVGGYGVQNINLLRGLVDYAFFGRAHDCLDKILFGIFEGGIHDDLKDHMILIDDPTIVSIRQAPLMVNDVFSEKFTGCPLKCKFCHYTYARKFDGETDGYTQSLLTGGNADEILYSDIKTMTDKRGRIRTAIDGFSERIRYLYGKRISNELIVDGINHLGDIAQDKMQDDMFGGHELNKRTVMTVYNISNFPYETEDDEQEFIDNIKLANPKTRVIFILHSTPFRASPATPMQWERVQVFPDWSAKRELTICDRPNLLVKYSYTLEGPWSQLLSAIVERSMEEDPIAIAAINYKSKNTSYEKTKEFIDKYDVSYHIGEHDIYSPPPGAWYLKSYLRDSQMIKIAEKMRSIRNNWN